MVREGTSFSQDYASQVRAFGQRLAHTERLSLEQLQAYQAPLVARLLLHARKTTKFYKDRLDFDLKSHKKINESWSGIPILSREEAVKNYPKLTSRKPPLPEIGPVIEGETSGSTGMPFRFKKNGASVLASAALTERLYRWWSVDGAKSLASIAAHTQRSVTAQWWHSSHPTGVRYDFGTREDVDAQLNWLMARRPHYLACYATILKELARAAQTRGIELRFAVLLSFATTVDDETRELCRAAFGAEIADTYGAQEVDHIAAQCRECGEYHISAETTRVEVLRSDGSSAAPGEIGRVVATPLYNYAMPLIRYELGDMAEVGTAPPDCGRGLPTLRRILGRYRNMFRYLDGSTSWPRATGFRLGNFIALKQFQVVQTDHNHVEIRYVPDDDATDRPIDLAALTQRVRTVLCQPVDVSVRRVVQIERSRGGKYEDCISLVSSDGIHASPPISV
jgi:phenylacetate-CoA ligase